MILKDRIAEKLKEEDIPIMTEAELLSIVATIPSHHIETPGDINEGTSSFDGIGASGFRPKCSCLMKKGLVIRLIPFTLLVIVRTAL